ncbi:MAG: HPr family phosphocarrier protein [Rhodospirillaceae bacterium]|nr:HPr family phosphocarrier protein [Rhodospirillaceae bacterium]MYB12381.1 HPr family phosphocarrier protein [Rhodospirillaceae bacterium]MYI49153.1 HPr family phosphocarrier protein [Rhodospirillaceae bacterium]
MPVRTARIVNRKGLHARAAAAFARTAGDFSCDVQVSRSGTTVSGHSIMGLMMLAAAQGTTIDIRAEGPDASAALGALERLIAGGFGEGPG